MTGTNSKKGTRKLLWTTALVAAVAAPLAGVSASVIVVRAMGPAANTYKPGKALPDDAKLALGSGDTVVVLGADRARTLKGPGTFQLASAGETSSPAVNATRRGRFSALRNAGIVPRSPTLWHVDVAQSGKMCLADASNVMLWRADSNKAVTLKVARPGQAPVTEQWAAGESTIAWPAGVAIVPGGEYDLSWDGEPQPTKLSFATLQPVPADIPSVAQALITNHCDNQLNLLLETVPSEAVGPS